MTDCFTACEALVRQHDPDRWLAALFAPAAKRPFLFALYAFNHEIAHIAEIVRQPMLGEIRLQWWRETVEQAREGRPREHDVARALTATFAANELPFALFDSMLDARVFDSSEETFDTLESLEAYCDATSGNLMRLAALVLGGGDAPSRDAGLAYAITGILRAIPFHAARGKLFLPLSMLDGLPPEDAVTHNAGERMRPAIAHLAAHAAGHYAAARALPKPGASLPAFLTAATVPSYLKRLRRPAFDPFRDTTDIALYRRQLAMLRAGLTGRV